MNRLGITFEDVTEAATTIQKNGEVPTIDKVRAYLGGTGSNTTISKYLNAWRHQMLPKQMQSVNALTAPDIVQETVNRVWQQMREQADTDIAAIKNMAQSQVDAAEQQAKAAEKSLDTLKLEYDELQQIYHRQSAEKELLSLDLKSLREEHTLLQERYKALDERYTDMQGLTSQHIKDISLAHKTEISRIEEKYRLQEENYQRLIDEIKIQNEKDLRQQLALVEAQKFENDRQSSYITELENIIKNKDIKITKLDSNLNAAINARDDSLKRLAEENMKWMSFQDKTLIPDELLTKIYDFPKIEFFIEKVNSNFTEFLDKKLFELTDTMKLFKSDNLSGFKNE